jgi:biotin carboxylase
VPSAEYALISSANDAEELIKKCGFPLIIKQISGIHSKYVAKVENKKELKKTIDFFQESLKKETGMLHDSLKNYSESHKAPDHRKHLLLEECLFGEELTIDAFIVNGEIFFTPICKYVMAEEIGIKDHHLPIRIMPYDLRKNQRDVILSTVKKALKALGADFCVTHTEVFFNTQTNECEVIEVAARGGGFRAEMVKNTCGGDYDLGIVRSALGLYPNVLNIPKKYAAVVEVFSPENGILNAIDASCIQDRKDILYITWNKKIGDEVGKASDGKSFILKFLVSEKTFEKAKSTAQELLKKIQKTIKTL